jgi:hypothetical protein
LERAQSYVAVYAGQLGAIIGEEGYVQNAEWRTPRALDRGQRVARAQRRLSSEFLLVRIEGSWFGARNVHRVDGRPVEARDEFASALVESPSTLMAIWPDNIRYNIGDFERTINVPTYALTILSPNNFQRFSFDKERERTIENVQTWEVQFSEIASPTMVRGLDGGDRHAQGMLWISPETGEILKTEIVFEFESADTVEATMVVPTRPVKNSDC